MAAIKKAGTAGQAAALPARRLAAVIPLPSALIEPVAQQGRRGRHPKGVASLWRARMDRCPELQAMRLEAQIEYAKSLLYGCYARANEADDRLKACELALKDASQRYGVLADEYGRLEAEVKRLEGLRAVLLRAEGKA